MKEGIKLFKIFGIEISLDFSWFIIFFLITWQLTKEYFPFKYPTMGTNTYWIMGIVSSLLLFSAVLLHELAHSVVANINGLNVKGIKLFVFGGVAQISREPQNARVEFDTAIAGPVCSFILHFVFKGLAHFFMFISPANSQNPFYAVCSYLSFINLFLGLINLIPAYPLDGGRILRAFLWARIKNFRAATSIASTVGKVFAVFLIFNGFMSVMSGGLSGLWWVFIGIFLFSAAKMGYEQVVFKDILGGNRVKNIMSQNVITIDGELSLNLAVENYFFKYRHSSFPVIENGIIKGLVSLSGVKEIPHEEWKQTKVAECVKPLTGENIVSPEEKAEALLGRFIEHETDHLLVMDGNKLVGILTRIDIIKLLKIKLDLLN